MNPRNEEGGTALRLAVNRIEECRNTYWTSNAPDWIEVVRILMDAGAAVEDPGQIQRISCDISWSGRFDVLKTLERHGVEMLLERGAVDCDELV